MKRIPLLILLFFAAFSTKAQLKITGSVVSSANHQPVAGASISINNVPSCTADASGKFTCTVPSSGMYSILISSLSYADYKQSLSLNVDTVITIFLLPLPVLTEEIIVAATRANEKTPVSMSSVSKTDIEKQNSGQDLPYLLNQLPSVVVTSDAGNGIGYTGIRIRGTDPSRINVTVNGIPINDAESHNMYWVDLPDLASSVENIQVQRGVGTSTNGAGAFGGSINIQTLHSSDSAFAEINSSAGSFNTFKNTVLFGSGRINKFWSVDGRLSKISSDGYIDRASSDLKSFFVSTGFTGRKTIARLQVFSGKEITYQSWNGVPEARLNNDVEGMMEYISRNFSETVEAENLLNSGRNYNYYTYKNQVDDYQQDYYQLHLSHAFSPVLKATAALHYTYGHGFYEEFKYAGDFNGGGTLSKYGLDDITIGNETISASDLVRRKWLKNDFYGVTFSLNYDPSEKHQFILGGAANEYDGLHFHELKWMQYAVHVAPDQRYFNDEAIKTDNNIFLKYTFNINKNISLFTDQQVRSVNYQFNGVLDKSSEIVEQEDRLNFYNPKAGIYIVTGKNTSAYASAGVAHKEPNRDDYTESTTASRPKPEQLIDYEAGFIYKNRKLNASVNFYYMEYKDQLVLTGALNDVGNYTRTNAPESYRTGVEIAASVQPLKNISAGATITFSQNKINSFTEYLTNYEDGTETSTSFSNTDIAFSPAAVGSAFLRYNITRNLSVQLDGKYVGKQFLDNTSDDKRSIDAYSLLNGNISYVIHPSFADEIALRFFCNNLLDLEYVSNGYTYGYIYGDTVRENMYYPQAGINFTGQIAVKF